MAKLDETIDLSWPWWAPWALLAVVADLAADDRRDALRHPLGDAWPTRCRRRRRPIVITGTALPEAKAERVYAVERIDARQIEQSPSHELDQLLKDVPGRAAVPPLRCAQRPSDQPGRDPARARRQRLEPGAAGARRRAAERPVRRLGQLAGLRSGEPRRKSASCAAAAASPTARARSPARSR